ncbi:MAG: Gfo/Idh/MocA family oxidoreductase, partial [Candidatus Latescibacteria bacterium]|nr:Gfo/Idh/MocA family oxidoreductase [Candidatus Latescibacterota bacterium]
MSANTDTIRLGVIGAGGNARGNTKALVGCGGVEVVAIAEPSPDNFQAFVKEVGAPDAVQYDARDGYQQMLAENDLTAVGIFSPHSLHFEQAMASLKAGAHVYCEKPMANGIDSAVTMVEYAEANGLVIGLGYQRHFEAMYATGRMMIEEGLIGDIKRFNVFMAQEWNHLDNWRADAELSGGGQVNDSGSHLQDIILWMTQLSPKRVRGTVDYLRRGESREVEVNCYVDVEMDGGATGSVTIEGDHEGNFTERINIEGTEGTLRFRPGGLYLMCDGATEELELRTMGEGYPSGKQDNFVGNIRGLHDANHASGRDGV